MNHAWLFSQNYPLVLISNNIEGSNPANAWSWAGLEKLSIFLISERIIAPKRFPIPEIEKIGESDWSVISSIWSCISSICLSQWWIVEIIYFNSTWSEGKGFPIVSWAASWIWIALLAFIYLILTRVSEWAHLIFLGVGYFVKSFHTHNIQ